MRVRGRFSVAVNQPPPCLMGDAAPDDLARAVPARQAPFSRSSDPTECNACACDARLAHPQRADGLVGWPRAGNGKSRNARALHDRALEAILVLLHKCSRPSPSVTHLSKDEPSACEPAARTWHLRSRVAWDAHRKSCRAVGRARGERAAVREHDLVGDVEAETKISGCRLLELARSAEGLKDKREYVGGNRHSLVANLEDNCRSVGMCLDDQGPRCLSHRLQPSVGCWRRIPGRCLRRSRAGRPASFRSATRRRDERA